MSRKRKSPTGATRVEVPDKGSYGWLMRIRRGEQFFQEFFSDNAWGGKRAAQRAARARYEELAAQLPPPGSSEGKLSSRNTTGTVGVRLAHSADPRGSGHIYDSYVAFWRDEGRDVTMRFACTKYGQRKAFGLAVLARELRSRDRESIEAEYAARRKRTVKPKPAGAAKPGPAAARSKSTAARSRRSG